MARILVGLGVPRHPSGGRQTKLVEKRTLLEGLRAHNADLRDSGIFALVDGNRDRHAVAFQRCDGRLNLDVVLATPEILALELLLSPIQQGAIENPSLGQAGIGQGLFQNLLVEFFRTAHLHCPDGWTFLHQNDQDLAVEFHPHVFEEPRGIQQPYRLRDGGVGEPIANPDGQVREHRARLDALKAVHPNILDHHAHRPGCTGRLWNGLWGPWHLHLRLRGSCKHQE